MQPIKYEKVCSVCDAEVKPEEIVKAYEYTKGKFVVLDEKELEKLKKENEEKAVEIINFVKIGGIFLQGCPERTALLDK